MSDSDALGRAVSEIGLTAFGESPSFAFEKSPGKCRKNTKLNLN